MLTFPDASTIKTHLASSHTLNIPYFQRRGIDKAISDLVAERFAGTKLEVTAINRMLMLAFQDLQTGKDGCSGIPLPKIEINPLLWNSLRISLENDLKKCAKTDIQSKL